MNVPFLGQNRFSGTTLPILTASRLTKLYIFLTMHLHIILVGNQYDAQFLLWYIYLNPLHVSSNSVLILRRTVVLIQLLV